MPRERIAMLKIEIPPNDSTAHAIENSPSGGMGRFGRLARAAWP